MLVLSLLAGWFKKRLAACCPAGVPGKAVEQARREAPHFGRPR
jgi:hypothetical protein